MAVTTSFSGSRRSSARAAAAFAAKQRRQKMIIAVGLVVLALILAYEVPHTLKLMSGSSRPTSAAPAASETAPEATPAAPAPAPVHSSAAWRALRHLKPQDPFANPTAGGSSTLAAVNAPSNLHDPFTAPPVSTPSGSSSSEATTTTTASASTPLPKTIVVGSPGGGRTAKTGWIVILASIPSAQGRGAANTFAKKAAARGVGKVSILDSSNARPLRGGYWVVYTGPFPTLTAVTSDASHLHASGYGTAYIRQLVVYGKS